MDGPARELLAAVMAWVSGFERQRLIERVHAGLDRARRQGKALGRPRTSIVLLRAAAELVEAGTPVAAAARAKGISRASLYRYLREGAHLDRMSRTAPGSRVATGRLHVAAALPDAGPCFMGYGAPRCCAGAVRQGSGGGSGPTSVGAGAGGITPPLSGGVAFRSNRNTTPPRRPTVHVVSPRRGWQHY